MAQMLKNILYPYSLSPELNDIKLFMAGIYKFSLKARVFVSDRPLQPSLMILGTVGSLLNRALSRWSGTSSKRYLVDGYLVDLLILVSSRRL